MTLISPVSSSRFRKVVPARSRALAMGDDPADEHLVAVGYVAQAGPRARPRPIEVGAHEPRRMTVGGHARRPQVGRCGSPDRSCLATSALDAGDDACSRRAGSARPRRPTTSLAPGQLEAVERTGGRHRFEFVRGRARVPAADQVFHVARTAVRPRSLGQFLTDAAHRRRCRAALTGPPYPHVSRSIGVRCAHVRHPGGSSVALAPDALRSGVRTIDPVTAGVLHERVR